VDRLADGVHEAARPNRADVDLLETDSEQERPAVLRAQPEHLHLWTLQQQGETLGWEAMIGEAHDDDVRAGALNELEQLCERRRDADDDHVALLLNGCRDQVRGERRKVGEDKSDRLNSGASCPPDGKRARCRREWIDRSNFDAVPPDR
jgi:hypothetical protein